MQNDLSPAVEAFLTSQGLLGEPGPLRRPDDLVAGGWYTLPDGERAMAMRTASGEWRLHRTIVTYIVRPWDGALLRYLVWHDPCSALAFTDWTVADLLPDPWVRPRTP
jgi:hypothetical protein